MAGWSHDAAFLLDTIVDDSDIELIEPIVFIDQKKAQAELDEFLSGWLTRNTTGLPDLTEETDSQCI